MLVHQRVSEIQEFLTNREAGVGRSKHSNIGSFVWKKNIEYVEEMDF